MASAANAIDLLVTQKNASKSEVLQENDDCTYCNLLFCELQKIPDCGAKDLLKLDHSASNNNWEI